MTTGLRTFIEQIDIANNFSDRENFEHMVLKAVSNLFGGNTPTNEILSEVYSELHRIERGRGVA